MDVNTRTAILSVIALCCAVTFTTGNASDRRPKPATILENHGVSTDTASMAAVLADNTNGVALRSACATLLGRSKSPGSFDALVTALNDETPEVRYSALSAMADLRSEKSVEVLANTLSRHKEVRMRLVALSALSRLGDHDTALESLATAASNPSESSQIRIAALRNISTTRPSMADAKLITPLLSDADASVRAMAAVALARSSDDLAVAYLAEAVLHPETEQYVKLEAAEALQTLTGQDFGYLDGYGSAEWLTNSQLAMTEISEWWRENQVNYRRK